MMREEADASLLERLSGALDVNDAQLIVPEVIQAELSRNIDVKWDWLRDSLHNYKRIVKEQNPLRGVADKGVEDAVAAISAAIDSSIAKRQSSVLASKTYIESLFRDDSRIELVPLTPAAMAAAMVMTISRTPPSAASSDMYGKPAAWAAEAISGVRFKYGLEGDCLILSSLLEFVNSRVNPAANTLVFCSDDRTAFAEPKGKILKRSIADKFKSEVVYYTNLQGLLEEELNIHDIPAETIADYESVFEQLRPGEPATLGDMLGRQIVLKDGIIIVGPRTTPLGPRTTPSFFSDFDSGEGGTLVPGCIVTFAGNKTYTLGPNAELLPHDAEGVTGPHDEPDDAGGEKYG